MKLSAISAAEVAAGRAALGFTVKSTVTGNMLKVIAKTPGGGFLVVKMSGKNVGKESLIEDNDRYEIVADKNFMRKEAIRGELKKLGLELQAVETKMRDYEKELSNLGAVAG